MERSALFCFILLILLFRYLMISVFCQSEVKAVPECEEGEADKETERAAQLGYEGDGRVDPGLPLTPDICGDVVVAQHEEAATNFTLLNIVVWGVCVCVTKNSPSEYY